MVVLLAIALGLIWAGVAAMLFRPISGWNAQDLRLYSSAAHNFISGMVPYRDFPLEYPPLALIPFVLPGWLCRGSADVGGFLRPFLFTNTVWCTLLAFCVMHLSRKWMSWSGTLGTVGIFALLCLIATPFMPWRFDVFPALLTTASVIAVLEDSPAVAGLLLGGGVATKLYPAVVLPVFWAWYLAANNRKSFWRLTVGAAVVPLAVTLPFLAIAHSQVYQFVTYHRARSIQLESVAAGVLMIGKAAGALRLSTVENYGAIHLVSSLSGIIERGLMMATAVSVSLVTMCAWRRFKCDERRDGSCLIPFVIASLLAFILTNKVFSPQYVVWLLPFVPLIGRRHAAVAAAAFALTTFIFPYHYESLIEMSAGAVIALNLRNLLLVWLAVSLVRTHGAPDWSRAQITPDPGLVG